MAQEDRNERRPENFRLSHRPRNRVPSGDGQSGAGRQAPVNEMAGTAPRGAEGRRAPGNPQPAGDRRAPGSLQSAGGRRAPGSPQSAGGRRALGSLQPAGGRRAPGSPQPAEGRRASGNPQSAEGRRASGSPQASGRSPRGSSEARWARWEQEKYRREKAEREGQQRRKRIVIIALAAAVSVLCLAVILWLAFGRDKDSGEPAAATEGPQTSEAAADKRISVHGSRRETGSRDIAGNQRTGGL